MTSLFWLSVHTFSLLEARVPMQADYDCVCTGSLSSRSETRPLRSLPSFQMMEDYKTALLRSYQTHSDLLVSVVSGKAAPQRSHRIYGLYFLSMKKTLKVLRHLQHKMTTGGLLFVCSNLWTANAWSLMILESYLIFDVF